MLSEKLQAVVARLADLPSATQDELVVQIGAWLSDREWDALLEDLRGDTFVAELMREAQVGPHYPWPGE